jgi:hypothetical protein
VFFVFEVERIGDHWVTSLHTKQESLVALTLFMEETLKASLHFPNWKGVDIGGYDVQCSL